MSMEKINVNSMEYRKLSKQDKLKVVNFKINEILNDKDSQKVYEYYRGKKVGVPKSKAGIFRDLCERKKSLEKTIVSYSDVQPVNEVIETTVKDAEIVDPIDEEIADNDKDCDKEEDKGRDLPVDGRGGRLRRNNIFRFAAFFCLGIGLFCRSSVLF